MDIRATQNYGLFQVGTTSPRQSSTQELQEAAAPPQSTGYEQRDMMDFSPEAMDMMNGG